MLTLKKTQTAIAIARFGVNKILYVEIDPTPDTEMLPLNGSPLKMLSPQELHKVVSKFRLSARDLRDIKEFFDSKHNEFIPKSPKQQLAFQYIEEVVEHKLKTEFYGPNCRIYFPKKKREVFSTEAYSKCNEFRKNVLDHKNANRK